MPHISGLHLARKSSALKKALLILAVLTASLLVVSLVRAAADWRTIGQTESGATVLVSSVRPLKNNQRVALVRVDFKEPEALPQGGPFVEIRARVHFNCSSGAASPTSEWFYTRDRGGRFVVSKKANHDDQFGKAPEGGFGDLVNKNVCGQK